MSDDPLGILPQIELLEKRRYALDVAKGVLEIEMGKIDHELSELRFLRMTAAAQDKAADRAARGQAA